MRALRLPLILFLAALVVRTAFIVDQADDLSFRNPLVDAYTYDRSARSVAESGLGAIERPYYQPPLYPMLLGLLYAATDGSWVAPRIVQALLGAAIVGLVTHLAMRASGTVAAIVAGVSLTAYGPAIYFEGELLPTTLVLFANTVALVLAARADEQRRSSALWFMAGVVLGVSCAARPTGLLLAAGVVIWSIAGTSARSRWRDAAVLVAGVALPILPFTIANLAVKEPVLVSWNGGINFYLGNGAGSDSLAAIQPGHAWDRLQVEPLRAGVTRRSEESRYWFRRGIAEAARDPAAWSRALGRKALRLLDAWETPRNTDYEVARRRSRILDQPLLGFGWVAPFAFLALASKRRSRYFGLLVIAIAAVAVENLLFFVAGRYRLEAVPVLCVLAGVGVAHCVREGVSAFRPVGLAAALAATVVTLGDWLGERRIDEARAALQRGTIARRAGFDAEAEREFRRALVRSPDDADAHRQLADLELARGEYEGAILHYGRAIGAAPDYVSAHLGRAQALEKVGRRADAEEHYLRALDADPWSAEAYLNYGVYLAIDGRRDQARRAFERGLEIGGDVDPEKFRTNLRRLDAGS